MQEQYIIGIDQSTQGTKAILLDRTGRIVEKCYTGHEQIVSTQGWVSHDGEEIFRNVLLIVRELLEKAAIDSTAVAAIGITNQRETTIAWDRETGTPVDHAIVWQCPRAQEIVASAEADFAQLVEARTGIPLSPYFPAAKAAWLLRNNPQARSLAHQNRLCIGTIDAWLVYKLTDGRVFRTDYSNASRTQLFNLHTLQWDEDICEHFGIPVSALPTVTNSDGEYGATTLNGYFHKRVPIRAVLGDSHAALFGQGCTSPGMTKATYGTGSSIMMNIGPDFHRSSHGLVTSIAWGRGGRIDYVLEGNINYTGAIVTWFQEIGLLDNAAESEALAISANPADKTVLVPAFTGLGAPYWSSQARAAFVGMSRTTGRAELVKAGLEAIVHQVTDIVTAMEQDTGLTLSELRVDGGPTANSFLMQAQSDLSGTKIRISEAEELSAIGAAVMAGISAGVIDGSEYRIKTKIIYHPCMDDTVKTQKRSSWNETVGRVL